jgi:hypothetical protein
MSDPRWTDPRYNDPPADPMLRRYESVGGVWGWIAGLAVLALIAFMIVAGWNNNSNTANSATPSVITGSAPPTGMAPSTTGSGGMIPPQPTAPTPAPASR